MTSLNTIDLALITFFRRVSLPLARISVAVIFIWFGFLKVVDLSPAGSLVEALFQRTIPFMSFGTFYLWFGLFECLIGLLFLVPGLERVVIPLLFVHMVTTFMPLVLLPQVTWSAPFVPTLEGQYIIKNVVIIATAVAIAAHLHPMTFRERRVRS